MKTLVIAVIVGSFSASAAQDNLLLNGDFEGGNTGFSTSYILDNTFLGTGDYSVVNDPSTIHNQAASFGDHTSGSGLMLGVNGQTTLGGTVWGQNVTVDSQRPYKFSLWLASWTLKSPADLEFSVNGVALDLYNAPQSTGQWTYFESVWFSGASTTATLELTDLETAFDGNDFALDDLAFVQVPEPTTFTLLGLGSLVLVMARRRR